MKKLAPTMADVRPPLRAEALTGKDQPVKKEVKKNDKVTLRPAQGIFSFDFLFGKLVALRQVIVGENKKFLRLGIIGLTGLAAIILFNLWSFSSASQNAFKNIRLETTALQKAAKEFQTENIQQGILAIHKEIQTVFKKARYSGLIAASKIAGKYFPAGAPLASALETAAHLSDLAVTISNDLNQLQKNGLEFITNQKGGELIQILERLEKNLALAEKANSDLKKYSLQIQSLSPKLASFSSVLEKNYFSIQLGILRSQDFLRATLEMLQQPEDQHLLLVFQNQSEIRPAGGFIGSYGDLVLNQGNLKEVKIDDIYNADRQLPLKSIPPRELRTITKNWGARDANWFFDFPTSAEKVISFLEASDLSTSQGIRYQGALAINTKVLQTLLEVAGPIELPSYGHTITGENFLPIIQREVEAGRDKKPGQNPKRILSALWPKLLEKLQGLNEEQKNALISGFRNHLTNKDIQIYFRDLRMENFLEETGLAGEVLIPPKDFFGDYLAVVNANIAGGKTDAFIDQQIALKSRVSETGQIINELAITRTHSGQNQEDWWYRVTNKNFLKILVPEKAKLLEIKGNDALPKQRTSKYQNSYEYDLDLAAIEQTANLIDAFQAWTGKEFGKSFFSAWFSTPAGESKTLTIIYENGVRLDIQDGLRYQFIFEKQSGVDGSLEYSITAPPEYVWKESGQPVFEYDTEQIKAREKIELTLIKL